MLFGKRLFPYPVLNSDKVLSAYSKSDFHVDYEAAQEGNDYLFKGARYILTSDYLQKLIDEGKAKVVLFVECSSARFRKVYELHLEPVEIRIPLDELNEKVSVSGYIVATKDIYPFSPSDLDESYGGFTDFTVEKDDVLAIDEFDKVKISHNVTDESLTSSIFTVVADPSIVDESMRVQVTKRKIRISLPKDAYSSYVTIKDIERDKWLTFALMLVPALAMALEKSKENGARPLDDLSFDYDWFISVRKRYEKAFGKALKEEEYYATPSFEMAQSLLDMPSTKALNDAFLLISKGGTGE